MPGDLHRVVKGSDGSRYEVVGMAKDWSLGTGSVLLDAAAFLRAVIRQVRGKEWVVSVRRTESRSDPVITRLVRTREEAVSCVAELAEESKVVNSRHRPSSAQRIRHLWRCLAVSVGSLQHIASTSQETDVAGSGLRRQCHSLVFVPLSFQCQPPCQPSDKQAVTRVGYSSTFIDSRRFSAKRVLATAARARRRCARRHLGPRRHVTCAGQTNRSALASSSATGQARAPFAAARSSSSRRSPAQPQPSLSAEEARVDGP